MLEIHQNRLELLGKDANMAKLKTGLRREHPNVEMTEKERDIYRDICDDLAREPIVACWPVYPKDLINGENLRCIVTETEFTPGRTTVLISAFRRKENEEVFLGACINLKIFRLLLECGGLTEARRSYKAGAAAQKG